MVACPKAFSLPLKPFPLESETARNEAGVPTSKPKKNKDKEDAETAVYLLRRYIPGFPQRVFISLPTSSQKKKSRIECRCLHAMHQGNASKRADTLEGK